MCSVKMSPFLKQTWTSSGVLFNMLAQGMVLSYPSCLLPALRAPDSTIQTDLETASWLSSSVGLASILGFMMSSFLMEWRGRRFTHALLTIPSLVGWLLIYFGQDVPTLMAGRVLGGVTVGATITLGAIAIGEYTSPQHRGMFLNLKTTAVSVANTLIHALASHFHWRTVAIISLVPQLIAFSIICTWPESPSWLASKRKFEKSEKVFYWLRGEDDDTRMELEEMHAAQRSRISRLLQKESFLEHITNFLKKFKRKDFVKPVIIVFFATIVLETSGRHVYPAYAIEIIAEITGDKTHSFYYNLGIDLIITASSSLASYLVRIVRRRTLLFASGILGSIVLMFICVYLYLASMEVIPTDHTWIPISLLVLYFVFANLGCTPIPLALMGEVFPLDHRGAGTAASGLFLSIFLMIILKITPAMLVSIKVYGTFAVFGITTVLALLVLYFMLPETKDRTLQQIEDHFNNIDRTYKEEADKLNGEELKYIIK